MKIRKYKNGKLKLQLEKTECKKFESIINNKDLLVNDLCFEIDNLGTLWLLDAKKKLAYHIADYFDTKQPGKNLFFVDLWNYEIIEYLPYGTF